MAGGMCIRCSLRVGPVSRSRVAFCSKPVLPYEPLSPMVEVEQFLTGHKKHSPALDGAPCSSRVQVFTKNTFDLCTSTVETIQPAT